jgi:cold shock CspA family protein
VLLNVNRESGFGDEWRDKYVRVSTIRRGEYEVLKDGQVVSA